MEAETQSVEDIIRHLDPCAIAAITIEYRGLLSRVLSRGGDKETPKGIGLCCDQSGQLHGNRNAKVKEVRASMKLAKSEDASSTAGTFQYDVFISYRRQEPDRTFARDLFQNLEEAGYSVAIDERDFAPNAHFLGEMERCIKESRFTVAVVSPRYCGSGNCEEELVICKVLDMSERRHRLVPITIERVVMPAWLPRRTPQRCLDA